MLYTGKLGIYPYDVKAVLKKNLKIYLKLMLEQFCKS